MKKHYILLQKDNFMAALRETLATTLDNQEGGTA